MGGFATGFLGALGDKAKQAADSRRQASDAQRQQQADIYWGVIKNPDSTPDQINHAHDQLEKLYPKGPEIKQIFDKFRGLVQQFHPGHQQGQAQGGAGDTVPKGEPNAPSAIPPPPQPQGAATPPGAAAPTATGTIATPAFNPNAKSAIPPPPPPPQTNDLVYRGEKGTTNDLVYRGEKSTPQPLASKGQDPRFAEMAKAAAGPSSAEQRRLAQEAEDHKEKVKHDYKMLEIEEAAKAKATNPTGRATAISPISMSEARKMAAAGQVFTAADGGDPLTLDDYDDTMMLVPLQQNGKIVGYSPASQKQTHLTYNNKVIAVPSLNQMDANVMGTKLGESQVGSTTRTTDPATGQTTVAVKTPNAPAAAGGAATSAPGATPTAPAAAAPATRPPSAKSAPGTGTTGQAPPAAPSATGSSGVASLPTPKGLPPLDADLHIPKVAGSPQVVEGANQLLDGQDVNKLPAKTRDLSAALARKYGWEQGKFTPKEQVMLRESTTFIDKAMQDDSLKVLDEGFFDRQKVARVVDSVDNKGNLVSSAITTAAAQNLTDDEAAFVRMYNQLVGTISGLGQLVRSGRATEATIERLKRELPNPLTTKDSKDAMARLRRLRDEVDVAMKKGTFIGSTSATPARKSAITAPPKPGDVSAGQLSQAAKDYLKSQNIPVE